VGIRKDADNERARGHLMHRLASAGGIR
jgi:hypothetical protein